MKIKWPGISNKAKIAQSQEEPPVEPVRILEVKKSEDGISLRVEMPHEFYDLSFTVGASRQLRGRCLPALGDAKV